MMTEELLNIINGSETEDQSSTNLQVIADTLSEIEALEVDSEVWVLSCVFDALCILVIKIIFNCRQYKMSLEL